MAASAAAPPASEPAAQSPKEATWTIKIMGKDVKVSVAPTATIEELKDAIKASLTGKAAKHVTKPLIVYDKLGDELDEKLRLEEAGLKDGDAVIVQEEIKLFVQEPRDRDWNKLIIRTNMDVMDLKKAIVELLKLTAPLNDITLHQFYLETNTMSATALNVRIPIAAARLEDGSSVVAVTPGPEAAAAAPPWLQDDVDDLFVSGLLGAATSDIDLGCQLIQLPKRSDGRPRSWPLLNSDTLFVRPIFKEFYEEHMRGFEVDAEKRESRTLLRGVPGIGKSSFGMYVLWRLVNEGHPVEYRYPKANDAPSISFRRTGDTRDAVYIIDGVEHPIATKMMMLSSPRGGIGDLGKVIYHEFQKYAKDLFMPDPSREEVLLMARTCFKDLGDLVSEERVNERMDRWGPIPRQVLTRCEEEEEADLAKAISTLSVKALVTFAGSEGAAVNEISFKLLRYNFLDESYRRVGYCWASPYVERKVAEILIEADISTRMSILRDLLKSPELLYIGAPLFEKWSGAQMAEGGTLFRIRRLGVGSTTGKGKGNVGNQSTLFVKAEAMLGVTLDTEGIGTLTVDKATDNTRPVEKATASTLLRPTAGAVAPYYAGGVRYRTKACFAAADFIERNGVCSNATVSQSHPLVLVGKDPTNADLLLPILKHMKQWSAASTEAVPFLWLVPPQVFAVAKAGPMIIEPPNPKEDPPSFRQEARFLAPRVVQYAVEIPSPSSSGIVSSPPVAPLSSSRVPAAVDDGDPVAARGRDARRHRPRARDSGADDEDDDGYRAQRLRTDE